MLLEEGYQVSRKVIRRFMQQMGICAIYSKMNLSKRNFKESIVPYLLRNYEARFPNQIWSIDITYIPMKHGSMYLTAIILKSEQAVLINQLDCADDSGIATIKKDIADA